MNGTTRAFRQELIEEGAKRGRAEAAEEILGELSAIAGSNPALQGLIGKVQTMAYPPTAAPPSGSRETPGVGVGVGEQSLIERSAATLGDGTGLPAGFIRNADGDLIMTDEGRSKPAEREGITQNADGDIIL